ncbi:MAG: hypothetical protein OXF31_09240 [Gammaproteobacteria bacterium]|nr:hypothetical protein [Gammaproteobacteria bacterium]
MATVYPTDTTRSKWRDRDLSRYRENFAAWCAHRFEGRRFILRKKPTGSHLQLMDQDFASEYVVQ